MYPLFNWSVNFVGYRVGVQAKRFVEEHENSRTYLALQAVVSDANTDMSEYLYFDSVSRKSVYHFYDIRKSTAAFNVKVGVQYFKGWFLFELEGGGGVKYRSVIHTNRLRPYNQREWDFYNMSAGKGWMPSFPCTVKIGFAF